MSLRDLLQTAAPDVALEIDHTHVSAVRLAMRGEQVVIAAMFDAYAESRAIQWTDFSRAIRSTVPLSVTQKERIEQIRQWANQRAVNASVTEEGARGGRGGRVLQF